MPNHSFQLFRGSRAYDRKVVWRQAHLKTDHFLKYKRGTLKMVKSLNLPTMQPLDEETMKLIFKKIPTSTQP